MSYKMSIWLPSVLLSDLTLSTAHNRYSFGGWQLTHEHLENKAAVSITGILVPAVRQVVPHLQDHSRIAILPANDHRC